MTTPQTKFSINSVKKTNTLNGIEFNGTNGTANIDMVNLEPTVLTTLPDGQPTSYISASYGNSPNLLGNVNEIKTIDCDSNDCSKSYNTSLSIESIGVANSNGPNKDISQVTINVENTVPSSQALKEANASDKIDTSTPYGKAIVGTYQIGYENCIGGPKLLYKPDDNEKDNYIINGVEKGKVILSTKNFKANVGRMIVADSTSYSLITKVDSMDASFPDDADREPVVLNNSDYATVGVKNQYNKVNAYSGWANITQAWGKEGEGIVWPPTAPTEKDGFWSFELNTKIGIIRDAPGTSPPSFWNNKMAFQFIKSNLRIANSPESKYSVYDGLNNMPDKFSDSLIIAGTLQQAFGNAYKFPETTFEPVCNEKVNMTNAESNIKPSDHETTLFNNYHITTKIKNSVTNIDTALDLEIDGLLNNEEFDIALSSLYILDDDTTWAYTPGYAKFGDKTPDNIRKYAEMTYVNLGRGPNSGTNTAKLDDILDYSKYKDADGNPPPKVSERIPQSNTIKGVLSVNVGTIMVSLYGKEILFNRFPIQPGTDSNPNPLPVYGNFYGHFLSEDWNYELVFDSPNSYKEPTGGIGENKGKWYLKNVLKYDTTQTGGKLDFTRNSKLPAPTAETLAISEETYSCLLPVNNIIDTDGNTHPNVTWKNTTLSGSPFVIKQICRAEMHTVTQ